MSCGDPIRDLEGWGRRRNDRLICECREIRSEREHRCGCRECRRRRRTVFECVCRER